MSSQQTLTPFQIIITSPTSRHNRNHIRSDYDHIINWQFDINQVVDQSFKTHQSAIQYLFGMSHRVTKNTGCNLFKQSLDNLFGFINADSAQKDFPVPQFKQVVQ